MSAADMLDDALSVPQHTTRCAERLDARGCICAEDKAYHRAYDEAHREQRRRAMRAWKARNREKVRAANAAYNARPEAKARKKAKAAANREAVNAAQREWYAANAERLAAEGRIKASKRRALKREATIVPFTLEQLEARLAMFAGCWICGGPKEEVDHVKPLSKGGAHCLANLRPACVRCNRAKRATWPFDVEEARRALHA